MTPGPLALVGGDEFHPGNEDLDRLLAEASSGGPAFVVCAAMRQGQERAATTARRWFAQFGIDVTELPVRSRRDACAAATVAAAQTAGLVYLAGGDPGRTVQLLSGTPVWDGIANAWRRGAALAGSSAGAMALCRWTLVRDRWPDHQTRRPVDALGLVDAAAVLPHFDSFGERWIPSALAALPQHTALVGVDERTAVVWLDDHWSVVGPGGVTVILDGQRHRFSDGGLVDGIPTPATSTLRAR